MKPHSEFPNIAEGATTADLYNRAVEIGAAGDRRMARRYFLALVDEVLENSLIPNMSREKAEGVVFTNIIYWLKHHEVDAEKVREVYVQVMGTFRDFSFEEMELAFNTGTARGLSAYLSGKPEVQSQEDYFLNWMKNHNLAKHLTQSQTKN